MPWTTFWAITTCVRNYRGQAKPWWGVGARTGLNGEGTEANAQAHGVDKLGVEAIAQLANAARDLVELDLFRHTIALGHEHRCNCELVEWSGGECRR